ncbi:reverse transcriptase [Phytophthora megakarya]|uniref:Reverse transcriptase n=1 Tax=Phytophthora megakarya TaxID=4795 RepID=A0A225W831_9STRA|nr:reverse transcriptase [Phytophthora megakarya]
MGITHCDRTQEKWFGHPNVLVDYRIVNGFITLSNYPLPLIDDLLVGFEDVMWFMSLGIASDSWAIKMSERAKLISAFVCPFGHFQWTRMPFELNNAPLIYQSVINNCRWGFVGLPPEEEAEVDQDVVDLLGLDPTDNQESERGRPNDEVKGLTDSMTVFQRNILMPSHIGPVLGRSSYIDPWRENMEPTFLPKSEFGKRLIPYLSHKVSAEVIRATPKVAKGVMDLPFPKSHKGILSFLGSLNYYHKFIEDFPVVAAVLYELSEDQIRQGRDLSRAHESFEMLKRKIVATPVLRHADVQKTFVVIPHANRWAACTVIGQEYGGKIQPVRNTGRVLNDAELRYHIAEKEVIAILRALQVFRAILEGRQLIVYTRYSVLNLSQQTEGAFLGESRFHIGISKSGKSKKDEDGLAAIMVSTVPQSSPSRKEAEVVCYGNYPNVTVNDAEYHGLLKGLEMTIGMRLQDLVAVGDSRIVLRQVQGLINCNQPHLQRHLAKVELLKEKFGSLRLAADYLITKTLILDESWDITDTVEIAHLEHVSKIAEKLMKVEGSELKSGVDPTSGETLSRDVEQPTAESGPLTKSALVLAAVRRSRGQAEFTSRDRLMDPLEFQAERWRRIRVHQNADEYLSEIKDFLKEDFEKVLPRRLRKITKVADLFVLDTRDVLHRLACSTRDRPRDFQDEPRLVVPKALRDDVLHYGYEDFQGGHQGITRTHTKLCSEFYWPGMYADVEHFVQECVDCASGKGKPPNAGQSPGNIEPRQPFEVVSMDFVTHMPKSDRGNTFLLLFQDMFSGYVMCKPMDSTTTQDVAEAYEERVFRNFGASSMIRHDQDPRFMSEPSKGHFGIPTPSKQTTGTICPNGCQGGRKVQRDYDYAKACAEDLQNKARRHRSDLQTQKWKELSERLKSGFQKGDAVWLYIPKVQTGLSKTLAHLCNGPFRIDEVLDDFRVKLKVDSTGYRVNPRLKPRALFPKRPTVTVDVDEEDEFYAALLPEDSWEDDAQKDENEVEKILDLRWSKKTRISKRCQEYLVKWKSYDDPEWLPASQLNCGALLYEFNQGARARARFQSMQAGDDHPRS